jgi:Tetratricopeptide repeat
MTLAWQQHFDRALREYDLVLTSSPGNLGARLGRARVLAWSGDYAASRAAFESVLRDHPDNLEALRGLGFVYSTRMQFGAARACYEKVLALSPGDAEARDGLAKVDAATRWQLDAAGGFVHFNHSATFFAANAGLSYQINPEHHVDVRYESNVSSSVVDVVTAPGAVNMHRAEFGWTARWNDAWTTELRYEPTLIGSDLWHRVALRGAFRFVPEFVAVAGVRPGLEDHGHREILADGGLQWLASDTVWLMAQDFAYVSDQQTFAYTVVGTGFWQMTHRFSARAGGGAGRTGSTPNYVVFARAVLALNDQWDLTLSYDYAHVTSVRHAAYFGAVVRF